MTGSQFMMMHILYQEGGVLLSRCSDGLFFSAVDIIVFFFFLRLWSLWNRVQSCLTQKCSNCREKEKSMVRTADRTLISCKCLYVKVSEEETSRHWVTWAPLGRASNRSAVAARHWYLRYLSLTCSCSRTHTHTHAHTHSAIVLLFHFFLSNEIHLLCTSTPGHHQKWS